jgi:hypothetical protein
MYQGDSSDAKYEAVFEFGPDAFRDNEKERALTQDVLDRVNAGDELSDLTNGELERIVQASKAEGTNEATRHLGMMAEQYLENMDEDGGRTLASDLAEDR